MVSNAGSRGLLLLQSLWLISVALLGGCGGRLAPGVTILGWHHFLMWNHNPAKNSTNLWWRPFFCSPSAMQPKTPLIFGEELFSLFMVSIFIWTEFSPKSVTTAETSHYKRWHHETPLRVSPRNPAPVPSFLATTLTYSTHFRVLQVQYVARFSMLCYQGRATLSTVTEITQTWDFRFF